MSGLWPRVDKLGAHCTNYLLFEAVILDAPATVEMIHQHSGVNPEQFLF